MSLTHRWTGRSDADLIGSVRMQCYAMAQAELPKFVASVYDDQRAADGDFLLVERNGLAVGTATSLGLTLHTRGAALRCHGVAYVGTIRTERRKSEGSKTTPGIATVVMQRTLEHAREQDYILSALMPFRASYYEHFGYGNAEHQHVYTIPTGVLPSGDSGHFVPFTDAHLPALTAAREKIVRAGNCDIDRPASQWRALLTRAEAGFLFVDAPSQDHVRAWVHFSVEPEGLGGAGGGNPKGTHVARVHEWGAVTPDDFVRVLRLLGSLKDQYGRVYLTTPSDLPLSQLLRESQLPHRPVSHATAQLTSITRMQIRILDHKRFLEALAFPAHAKGEAVVSILETEGHESRFLLRIEGGRASVSPSAMTPTYTTSDKAWGTTCSGLFPASTMTRWQLASGDPTLLDCLAHVAKPFCSDHF